MVNKEYEIIQTDKYDGIQMQEYNGKFGILAMTRGQNDVWYKVWIFLSRWSNGRSQATDKKMTKSVRIGEDKTTAVKTLETLLKQIKGG